jgi:hypothetical protein
VREWEEVQELLHAASGVNLLVIQMMKHTPGRFFGMLGLNLLASYVPAFLWVPSLPGTFNVAQMILISPVILTLPNNRECLILGIFFLTISILALALNGWPRAIIIVPVIIFVYSLVQGLMFLRIMQGIDAIGHS